MRRFCVIALLAVLAAAADPEPRRLLKARIRTGDRYSITNKVSYELELDEVQGNQKRSTSESVERTERFVDVVGRAGERGGFEIERTYLKLYTKIRTPGDDRARVVRSPLTGRTLLLRERRRRLDVKLKGAGTVEGMVRRTVGIELDWRDVLPDEPVGPGDSWKAEAGPLSQKLAAYLKTGQRYAMHVRYEGNTVFQGVRCARLYVDWSVEGMRDRNLFAKVSLAGDVYFDLQNQRFLSADLAGSILVRGAVLGDGPARIVNGQGLVHLKTTISPAQVRPSAAEERKAG
ncbi:MAG: hypothetical protein ACE5JG_08330 [Planctomycetota bacterium]